MSNAAEVKCFFDKGTNTAQYVITDKKERKCAVLDSVWDFEQASGTLRDSTTVTEVADYIKSNNLSNEWILETHAHADHISAAVEIKKLVGGKLAMGSGITTVQETFKPIFNMKDLATDGSQWETLFDDKATFSIGSLKVEVLHTPGHTPACVSYYLPDAGCVFVGDTLFMPDGGTARCDFPKGSVHDMWVSLTRLLSLPSETVVYCCHDYGPGGRDFAWKTTVAEQREKNIHVKDGTTEADYTEFRSTRDAKLAPPKLLLPSLQMNISGGTVPFHEDNGKGYLKIPLTMEK